MNKVKCAILTLSIYLPNYIYSLSPGDLDPTFGTNGVAITNFGNNATIVKLLTQSDSKVVAAGKISATSSFALARYNYDGSLDTTFGTGGTVITTPVDPVDARSAALQPDGKIVLVANGQFTNFAARYNTDGSLDTSFGNSGILSIPVVTAGTIFSMAIQTDSKILIGGEDGGFYVARLNNDGTIDTTFGNGSGIVNYDNPASAESLAIQSDGKIVVAGGDFTTNSILIARLNTDGSLDTSFGGTGIVTISISGLDIALDVQIQPNGKIVAAGTTITNVDLFPCMVRVNSDGSIDNSFGTNGILIVNQPTSSFNALGLQNNGKIIGTGDGSPDGGITTDFLMVRVNNDGTLDNTYGNNGIVLSDIGGTGTNSAKSVVINPFNNLATAGGFSSNSPRNFTLARYLPIGAIPPPPPPPILSFSMNQAGSLFVSAPGLLVNQPAGSLVILLTPPANGIISISADGSFAYVPNADFSGADSFTYTISTNGVISSTVFTVVITVVADTTLATSGIGAELVHAIRKKYGTRT